jgi:hypothetical protein
MVRVGGNMEGRDVYDATEIALFKTNPEWLKRTTDGLVSNIEHLEGLIAAFRQAEVFRVAALVFGEPSGNGVSSYETGEWHFNAGDEFNEPDDPELRGALLRALTMLLHDRRRDLVALGVSKAGLQ